jgi:hypothetical protein
MWKALSEEEKAPWNDKAKSTEAEVSDWIWNIVKSV